MATDVKLLEFKINIKGTPKEYVDGLILGLVHCGYDVYLSGESEEVCFNGWADEVITQKIKVIDGA